jgi:hypothetical protein
MLQTTSGGHSNLDLLLPTFFFLFFFPNPTLGRPYTKIKGSGPRRTPPRGGWGGGTSQDEARGVRAVAPGTSNV